MTTEQTVLHAQGVVQASSQQELARKDGTPYSRFVLDILLDGRQKPTRFSTFDDKAVPKGVRGKRVLVEYVDAKATDSQGKPLTFHNLTKLTIAPAYPEPDDAPSPFDGTETEAPWEASPSDASPRARPPAENTPASKQVLQENRIEQGMAYGNAHHAAARLLSAYLIAYHHEPNDEEMDRLVSMELELARRIYEGREAL